MTVYDTLRNSIGYMQLDLGLMLAQISILENPSSSASDKIQARGTAKQATLNLIKMLNTITSKAGYSVTLNSNAYTDQELTNKRLLG